VDFTGLAMFQIAKVAVVHVVIVSHGRIRREGDNRKSLPCPIIVLATFEQRGMASVMLQHIEAHGGEAV
jgi:hypothetical protein